MKKTTAIFLVISLIFLAVFSIYLIGNTYKNRTPNPFITRFVDVNRSYPNEEPTTPSIDMTVVKTIPIG